MKTILVPTDFSKNAENAMNYAVTLAKKENAKIVLLHAFHIVIGTIDIAGQLTSDIVALKRKEANKKLQDLCFEIMESKKVKCEFMVRFDLATDAILETVTEIKPDLVVMGTKGASGIKKVLIGSNTASVIEKSKCPVIAVPEGVSSEGVKKITYATDYLSSDIEALKKVVDIAKLFKAKITILHASDEELNDFNEREFLKLFRSKVEEKINYDKISYKLIAGKRLHKVLEEHIRQESPDLLAMSTHHRNLMDKIFGTSVTKKMAFHIAVPLLVFHHKSEPIIFT